MIIGNFGAAVNSQDRMPPICPTAWSAPLWTFLANTDKKNWQQKTNILSPSKSFSIIHFEPFHPDISYLSVFIHSIHFHPTNSHFYPMSSTSTNSTHFYPTLSISYISIHFHPLVFSSKSSTAFMKILDHRIYDMVNWSSPSDLQMYVGAKLSEHLNLLGV